MRYLTLSRLLSLGCAIAALHCAAGADSQTNSISSSEVTQQISPPLARAAARAIAGTQNFTLPQRYGTATRALMSRTKVVRSLNQTPPTADSIETYLNDYIFTQANVQQQTGGSIVYQIHGDVVCGADPYCASTVDALKIQVAAKQVANGYDISITMGAPSFSPMTMELRSAPESVSADFDVSAFPKLLALSQSASGGTPQPFDGSASGHLGISSSVDNANNSTLQVEVLEAVQVSDANKTSTLAVAATPATWQLASQGAMWTASCNLGAVDITEPYANLMSSNAPGEVKVHLGGLNFSATADNTTTTPVAVDGFGFGPDATTVTKDGVELLHVELNPQAGHKVSALITPDNASTAINLNPGLNLTAAWNLQSIANDVGDVPAAELSDTLVIDLQGTNKSATVEPREGDIMGIEQSMLFVQDGTLTVTTHAGSVTVAKGQCLEQVTPKDPNSLLSNFASVSCP